MERTRRHPERSTPLTLGVADLRDQKEVGHAELVAQAEPPALVADMRLVGGEAALDPRAHPRPLRLRIGGDGLANRGVLQGMDPRGSTVREVAASHSLYVSQPAAVAKIIEEAAKAAE